MSRVRGSARGAVQVGERVRDEEEVGEDRRDRVDAAVEQTGLGDPVGRARRARERMHAVHVHALHARACRAHTWAIR